MLASNFNTDTDIFDNLENFYQPHNMDDIDLKITSQDFCSQSLEDSNLFQTQLFAEEPTIDNSQNSIFTGIGKDVMLGTGNDWCENLSTISQSKYVTSSSQSYTNTVKRKAETMTNHTNTAILPIKRNKLDLKVRIQQINAQELTSTNTVGQFQTIDPPLNTASICNDILDMQAPPEFVSIF